MKGRTLVWRGALVAFFVLAALQMLQGLSLVRERARDLPGRVATVPERLAAVLPLLRGAPGDQRRLVVRAGGDGDLGLSLANDPPAPGAGETRIAVAEAAISREIPGMADGDVIVVGRASPALERLGVDAPHRWWFAAAGLRIGVRIDRASWLIAEPRGADPTRQVFGLPTGLWAGLLGNLAAALAIFVLLREARPLRRLAEAVEEFGRRGAPVAVDGQGGPALKALAERFTTMQARIAALINDRTLMLASIAHDLKTYITRVRLRLELLEDNAQAAAAVRDLDDAIRLLDDALLYSRAAAGPQTREPVDLAALIEREVAERRAAGSDATLTVDTTRTVMTGDPVALRRLLLNVVGNAIRYGGKAAVTLTDAGGRLRATVDDAGPGIPPEARTRVFEPFVRIESSRSRETGGSGLGLAIARQIVDGHGGTIAVADAPGGGARILIDLPRGDATTAAR